MITNKPGGLAARPRRFFGWLEGWLFPEGVLCLCCDRALDGLLQDEICFACASALEALESRQEESERRKGEDTLPEGIDFVHSAYPYDAQARALIHKLKFKSVRSAAVPLARPMAYLPAGEEVLIVPVPTDQRRMRKRGFNQSTLLAEHIASVLGMPMEPALVRTQRRAPQTGLPMEKRRSNLIGCMRAGESVRGRRILLIDDVYTTGSTVCEAARALRAAGAAGVGVLTACRAGLSGEEGDPFSLPRFSREIKKN